MRVVPTQVVAFIETFFPQLTFRSDDEEVELTTTSTPMLLTLAGLIEAIPDEIISRSTAPFGSILVGTESIRWHCRLKESAPTSPVVLAGRLKMIKLLHAAVKELPDQVPTPGSSELMFLEPDTALRENLATDLSAAYDGLKNNQWKATTVLAGGVLEGLLLWAIQSRTDLQTVVPQLLKQKPDLLKWDLADYITAAGALNLISKNASDHASLAREYRNLIHPGRAQRLKQKCTKATAYAAIASVEFAVVDLEAHFKK